MKTKWLTLFACIGALLATNAWAAPDGNGFFVDARVGSSGIDRGPLDDREPAGQLSGGYRWGWFGVEAGYAHLGEFESRRNGFFIGNDIDGLFVGINARGQLSSTPWYFAARAGAFRWNLDAVSVIPSGQAGERRFESEFDGTDWYAGVGMGYDYNEHFSVGLAFDGFLIEQSARDEVIDTYSVVLEYRF